MKKAAPARELNAVIVGSKSSHKGLVGNLILGRKAFGEVDDTSDCESGEAEVCGRRVSLVKAPGWLRGYPLCDTPELFRTEMALSVTLRPPGLHGFLLVVNAELPFREAYVGPTKEHLRHSFGEKVWDHTLVVFSHRGRLGRGGIEDYFAREGAPLLALLEACGGRYHVLGDDGTDGDGKVRELFEKIDAMVADNSCYQIESTRMQSVEERRREVDKKAEELRLQSQQQRQKLRNLLRGPTPNLRILMVGWVFSGKSATGNQLLGAEVFKSEEKTMRVFKQSGEVAGREVIIVDTPGWWKFLPAMFTPPGVKAEILKGVPLCSPSPNVILLVVPLDSSFTDAQKTVTEANMRTLGHRVWRHVIVLFTFGDALGHKTIEQHIESEGEPLRWLIEKCGKRYHVLNNRSKGHDQVTELLEKMEEMVAGNSSFYLSETDDPQTGGGRSDELAGNEDENTAEEITERLIDEWDRRNREKRHSLKRNNSMESPLYFGEDKLLSDGSGGKEEEVEHEHEDDQLKSDDLVLGSEDDPGSGLLNKLKELLEREWSRRKTAMEIFYKLFAETDAISEPDSDQLPK